MMTIVAIIFFPLFTSITHYTKINILISRCQGPWTLLVISKWVGIQLKNSKQNLLISNCVDECSEVIILSKAFKTINVYGYHTKLW